MVASHFEHFVAIDWSGATGERQCGIAVALCARGDAAPVLVRPEARWSRADVLAWLIEALPPATLVGLDLGPSLPFVDRGAFFPGWSHSPPDARHLWQMVETICAADPHLSVGSFVDHPEASRHFRRHGGREGDCFGGGRGRLRVTEQAQRAAGLNPYSNLNLVGAAQVGKASLSGMRVLHRLQHHLPVWPFDSLPRAGSLVVEIYTSLAALAAGGRRGRSKLRSVEALNAALTAAPIGSLGFAGAGAIDDHRADALLSAAWLRANADRADLWQPPALRDPIVGATEGWTFGVV